MPRVQVKFSSESEVILVASDGESVVLSTPARTVRLTREEAWRLAEAIDEVATSAAGAE